MVNLQNEGLRYDPALIWIDDADKQAKWYQQLKREWTEKPRRGARLLQSGQAGRPEVEELIASPPCSPLGEWGGGGEPLRELTEGFWKR